MATSLSNRNDPIRVKPPTTVRELIDNVQKENFTNHINNAFAARPTHPTKPRSILDKIKTDLGRPDIVRVGLDDSKGRWSDLSHDTAIYQQKKKGHFWDLNANMGPLSKFTMSNNPAHVPKAQSTPAPKLKPRYPKANQTFTHIKDSISSGFNTIKNTVKKPFQFIINKIRGKGRVGKKKKQTKRLKRHFRK